MNKPEPDERRSGTASFKLNLTMPTLHDSDFEFWKHWNSCQNVARCQTAGADLNEMDFMSLWMPTMLPEGGVRALTVKTHYERACRKGRLPHEVKEVLVEMRNAVALLLTESDLEKAERLQQMWNDISQGASTHAEFKVKWVALLDDIDGELPQVRCPDSLFRKYLGAIKQDLRVPAMRKDSAIQTPTGTEYRRPRTWEELAACCEEEIKSRIDTQASGERINRVVEGGGAAGLSAAALKRQQKKHCRIEQLQVIDEERTSQTALPACPPGVPSKICEYCPRPGHWKEVCPKYAAEHRTN